MAHLADLFGQGIDHDEGQALGVQLLSHVAAHPAVAADDDVIGEFVQHAEQASFLEVGPSFAGEQEIGHAAQQVHGQPSGSQNEHDGEELATRRQRLDFAEADRAQGDHGHVEGIQQLHALQQPEPRRTQQQQADQGNRRFPEAPMRVGDNPPLHQELLDRPGSSQDQPTRRNDSIIRADSIKRPSAAAD